MFTGSVLVTGGTGYIGSFTALALLEAGYKVVIADNLYNSSQEAINRIALICGKKPDFYNVDVTEPGSLDPIFEAHPDIDSVIHFAALKVCLSSEQLWAAFQKLNHARLWENQQKFPLNTTALMSSAPSAFLPP